MATFRPPVASTTPWVNAETKGVARSLFRHFGTLPCGRTVLKENGVYSTVDTPTQVRVAAAEAAYQGGHEYEVSDAVAAELTSAGYGANLS